MTPHAVPLTRDTLPALLGPPLFGACFGLRFGAATALGWSLGTLALVVGVAALMTPTLLILSALLNLPARAGTMIAHVVEATRDVGWALLGLAPAMLVVAATGGRDAAGALGAVAIAACAAIGIWNLGRALHAALPNDTVAARALLGLWAITGLALGMHGLTLMMSA